MRKQNNSAVNSENRKQFMIDMGLAAFGKTTSNSQVTGSVKCKTSGRTTGLTTGLRHKRNSRSRNDSDILKRA